MGTVREGGENDMQVFCYGLLYTWSEREKKEKENGTQRENIKSLERQCGNLENPIEMTESALLTKPHPIVEGSIGG